MFGFSRLLLCLKFFLPIFILIPLVGGETVRDSLKTIERIIIPSMSEPVNWTVAEAFQKEFSPEAKILAIDSVGELSTGKTVFVGISGQPHCLVAEPVPDDNPWMYFAIQEDQSIQLVSSHSHLLYTLFCRVRDEWAKEPASKFSTGQFAEPTFPVVIGEDGFYGFWRRFCVGYDPESAIQESARLGASHVLVNALPQPMAMEDGPAGEVYYRFYQYLPDLDQYVETELNRGTYPPEYLEANLRFLKEQVALAVKYGLTPGMHVANPRSAPESLLEKYPYLRGPRVDHPFRSYRPRYTLTLAHPVVRWHYATLIKNLLSEVPEIGFLTILINDSGSGFEYTESLYAGRNGGPYLVREWRPGEEIAQKAADLVIKYYTILRDAAREINPDFRIQMGLNNIEEEKQIIYDGLGDGLDRLVRTQRENIEEDLELNRLLEERKSYRIAHASAEGNPYIIGLPAPWQIHETLVFEKESGTSRLEVLYDPPSVAPYDINREVLRAFQFEKDFHPDDFILQTAHEMVGGSRDKDLVKVWKLSDQAVRQAPVLPLYGDLGFAWYRFWVRPFIPDIEAIPVRDRAYYEDYMLTVFNNPHNVDLQADALWDIHSVEESADNVRRFDKDVLPLIKEALATLRGILDHAPAEDLSREIFVDLECRLRAYECYSLTLRNISAWIAGVHGYLDATTFSKREEYLQLTREMVHSELENARNLLDLWKSSESVFMPIHEDGEWMHDYGPNFGELLEKKILLMERYGNLPPRIDPNYMWRMPEVEEVENAPQIESSEYLEY